MTMVRGASRVSVREDARRLAGAMAAERAGWTGAARPIGRRRLLVAPARGLAGALLAGALAAACGPLRETPEAGKTRQQVTITFWGTDNPVIRTWWHAAVAEGVEKRWPHIRVNDETPAGKVEKVYAAVAAGNPPDATVMDAAELADLASKGAVLAIDGYVRTHRANMGDYLPYHVEAAKWRGKQYGLSAFGGFHQPGYNQTLAQAAGLPDPLQEEAKGTWTWAKYVDLCNRLTVRQGNEAAVYGTARGDWRMWVINNGGNVLSKSLAEFTLDRPEAVEALQFWVDLVHKHRVAPTDEENRQQNETARWASGRLGFWYAVRGGLGTQGVDIRDSFKWNVVPVPRGKTKKTILFSNGQTFAFTATKHADDAFLFVWGWSGHDGQVARLNAGDPLTPSLRSVAFAPAFLNQTVRAQGKPEFPVPPNFNQSWAEEMRKNNLEGIPIHPKLSQILGEVNKGLAPTMAGTQGVPEAVQAMKRQVQSLLRES